MGRCSRVFAGYAVDELRADRLLSFSSDIGLRGCNLEKSVVIIDEAQNATCDDLKLILTRIHDDCHVVLIGDSLQDDNRIHKEDFSNFCQYMCEPSWATKVTLTRNFRGLLS